VIGNWVNNAGMQHVAKIEDLPTEKFEFIVKLMLTGSFIGTKKAFPIMKKQQHGRIINMAFRKWFDRVC